MFDLDSAIKVLNVAAKVCELCGNLSDLLPSDSDTKDLNNQNARYNDQDQDVIYEIIDENGKRGYVGYVKPGWDK